MGGFLFVWYNSGMTVHVGTLHKKRIVRGLDGRIIDWLDEADGGWIIQKGRIVNQAKYDEYVKKEEDRKKAAETQILAIKNPDQFNNPDAPIEERNGSPSRQAKLEERVDKMEETLAKILKAVTK